MRKEIEVETMWSRPDAVPVQAKKEAAKPWEIVLGFILCAAFVAVMFFWSVGLLELVKAGEAPIWAEIVYCLSGVGLLAWFVEMARKGD